MTFCYVQVDLGHDMRVTALSTIGVRVKNASTGNYSFMYVSQYFLAYKRDGDKTWRRYHRNDVSLTVRIDWDHLSYSSSFYSSYQSVRSEKLKNYKHYVNIVRRKQALSLVQVHVRYFLILC